MDLDHFRQADLSRHFVSAYVSLSKDQGLIELLDFYKCYRAYVRGKVESFKLDDHYISEEERETARDRAQNYFRLAYQYSRKVQPLLLVMSGIAGTGKSTIAQALSQKLGFQILSSDVIRKQLAGIPLTEHRFREPHSGIYSAEFSQKTYDEMFFQAQKLLSQGDSVALDATFSLREGRLRAKKLAEETGAQFIVIECRLEESKVKERMEKRLREGSVSDARWHVFMSQKEEFDKITELSPEEHIIVDTSKPVEEVIKTIPERIGN